MTPGPGEPSDAGSVRAAVIDIGSNSVLLLTVALEHGGRARAVDEALATPRLGAGLAPGGVLDAAARTRTLEAVRDLAGRARAAGAHRTWAFATGAARDAADGRVFADEVEAAAGIPVEVLTGEREARLAYGAVRAGLALGAGPVLVVDVGGRTTELTLGMGADVLGSTSLPLGALSLAEAHGTSLRTLAEAVDAGLTGTDLPLRARRAGVRLFASGGTATALAALHLGLTHYQPRRVHGSPLGATSLGRIAARVAAMSPEERRALTGIDPGRAEILPAGATILARVAAHTGVEVVIVSDHGVRHGYLREALARGGVEADLSRLWP